VKGDDTALNSQVYTLYNTRNYVDIVNYQTHTRQQTPFVC